MAYILVETVKGPQKVRVCDYCKRVCIPSGRFCSGHCSRNYWERVASWKAAEQGVASSTNEPN